MENPLFEIEDLFAAVVDSLKNQDSVEISKKYGLNEYRVWFEYDYFDTNEADFEQEYSDMLYSMRSRGWNVKLHFDEFSNKHFLKINI
jgi:hypothetical protein